MFCSICLHTFDNLFGVTNHSTHCMQVFFINMQTYSCVVDHQSSSISQGWSRFQNVYSDTSKVMVVNKDSLSGCILVARWIVNVVEISSSHNVKNIILSLFSYLSCAHIPCHLKRNDARERRTIAYVPTNLEVAFHNPQALWR